MPHAINRTALLIMLACVALIAGEASAQAPAGASQPAGPGGRTPLTRWTRSIDPGNRGLALGWQRGGFSGTSVGVPDVVRPDAWTGPAGLRNYDGSVAWYRTTVQAASAGEYAITFQSANFSAQAWIDGRAIGAHRGSYLPFQLRANLTAGPHTLVVRVDWRDPAAQSRTGFHRTWFNWGGVNGAVEVRPIGASELSEPSLQTSISPGAASGPATVTVGVRVTNHGPARTLTPEGSLVRAGQHIALAFAPVSLAHGASAAVQASATVPDPALWSPAAPNLYALSLAVGGESSYTADVGLRQLTWHGGRMYLNGAQLFLHGASLQEDAPDDGDALSPADERALVAELRSIHANAVRSQHPLDPGLLELLDAAGILVWQGIGPVEGAGNWYSNTPGLLAEAEGQARTATIADQLHPSILAWNLVDEVAENGRDGAEVSYVQSLKNWLHAYDPTRMVAVDVWGDHPPTRPGALYRGVDAIAETDYSGWYDNPRNSPAAVSAEISRRLRAMQRTFAGKVLLISEFGAESNALNPTGSPGSYSFQSSLLARHIRAYAADSGLSGMFVYLLRDYPLVPTFEGGSIHGVLPRLHLIEGLNQKGLFTYGGRPKPAVSVVARSYRALGSG